MKIHCPACNAEYEVEESAVGRRVQCECGHKWEIQPDLSVIKNNILDSLQKYVSLLQKSNADQVELEPAEKALFAFDPENPLVRDFAEIQKNTLKIVFQESGIEYTPKTTRPSFDFPLPDSINPDCRYAGKCVLFTGFSAEEKQQIALIAEFLHINQPSNVCQKLDFLICGSNAGPSKIRKAEELGKPIIQAADFIQEITVKKTE